MKSIAGQSIFWYGTLIALLPLAGLAEEGGSGHYLPGSMASFLDGAPSAPTFIARLNLVNYDGQVAANRELPVAGDLAANLHAKSNAIGLTVLWAPDWDVGKSWTYSMSATVPFVSLEVTADVVQGTITGQRSDKETGLGDLVLIPVLLNYQYNPNLNLNMRLSFYAPTGDYEVGRLANTGKNFWTVEPTIALIYFGLQNGIEASLFAGVDFNAENDDTQYKSGAQAHMEGTLAQHFPLWGGLAGAGATGFWYQQVEGDSGSGATLGAFKARAHGIGPVVSYSGKAGDTNYSAEFKWLHEFDNQNRPEGDFLWLKVLGKF